jgi:hypothetical protein
MDAAAFLVTNMQCLSATQKTQRGIRAMALQTYGRHFDQSFILVVWTGH